MTLLTIQQAAARIEQLDTLLAETIKLMTEASREAGHWRGKYEAAGYPGTLDGWIEKAKTLEAENARLRSHRETLERALTWYGENARLAKLITSEGDLGRNNLANDGGNRARAALAGKEPA